MIKHFICRLSNNNQSIVRSFSVTKEYVFFIVVFFANILCFSDILNQRHSIVLIKKRERPIHGLTKTARFKRWMVTKEQLDCVNEDPSNVQYVTSLISYVQI